MKNPGKIFVTGGGGLIGSAVCAQLFSRGFETVCLLKEDESPENVASIPKIEIVKGDIRNGSFLSKAMAGCDGCIHLAALNKLWHKPVKDYYDVNFSGTKNVCQAASQNGILKFIHISSCEIMGQMKVGQTGSEKNSPGKKTLLGPYAQSKYLAEEYVQTLIATGFPATIIRPTAVIGPGDINLTPPGELIRSSLGGKLKIYFNAFINVIDSRDVAHAAVEALFTEPGKTYIAGSHNVEIAEIIRRISRTTEKKRMPLKLPYFAAYFGTALLELAGLLTNRTPAFTTRDLAIIKHPWTFDSSKATRELGLTSRPLQTTIDDAVNWHRRKIWMNS